MLKILFLCPRIPYPPIKGDKLRAYYQISELSRNHRVTLMTFTEECENAHDLKVLNEVCEHVVVIHHKKYMGLRSAISHVLDSLPLQCGYYSSSEMERLLFQMMSSENYDIVHVQLARMVQYISKAKLVSKRIPAVVDFVDALSLNMKKRLEREQLVVKPFFFYEWLKMKSYEAGLEDYFDCAVISSPVDRMTLPYASRLKVLPNGVNLDYFRFENESGRDPDTIIFTGNMGYFPNIDAVMHFARYSFPRIKRKLPRVKFKIVGNCPPSVALRIRSQFKEVEVIGYVTNVYEHLSRATIAVAPMLSGSGIQNKVLEAMATGTPLVATRLATQAIDARPDHDILIADGPSDFARAVVKLFNDQSLRCRLGINGRKLTERKYSWASIGLDLENIYQEAIEYFHKNR